MALTLNVGLSRKRSQNYQSDGVSINIVAELDQTLLARPDDLQRQIDQLYRQAQAALARQSLEIEQPAPAATPSRAAAGRNGSNGNGRPAALMTASQRRAIEAIAGRLNIDPAAEAHDIIGNDLDHLSLRQASQLIDHLRGLQSANGNGGAR